MNDMSLPISAIILAAGYSSRMGAFKPLLPFGDTTVMERSIALFRRAGIRDIRVVVGHNSSELLPLLKRLQALPLLNERYQEGMYSSVVAAVESLKSGRGAFFLLPVDIPLVQPATIESMISAYGKSPAGILYPTCCGVPGHPPLIACSYRDAILSWNGDGGLKTLLTKYERDSAMIETGDEGTLLDMDTPEDYNRLRGLLERTEIPSPQICERLLCERFAADSPVVEHCRKVARLANNLAVRLNDSGCHLNLSLIEAAALLHDLAKGEPRHAAAGAAILRNMGYVAVADLIAVHMELPSRNNDVIDAADLLFLADKLVEGTRVVTLETRFRRQLERHAHDRHILACITRRLESARTIKRRVEERLGLPIDDVLMDAQA